MKHRFIAKRYWKDGATAMGQSDVQAAAFPDCIDLSLGDPDLTTPEIIIRKSFEDALAGHTKYTDFRGDPQLRGEIQRYYQEEYDVQIHDSEIFVCASACLGMYLVMETVLDDGDEVILQAPYFTPYKQQVELARGVVVELPTFEQEKFQISIERLKGLITERTKALVLNTPSNPTGACLSLETMEQIAAVAREHDLLVIADDIYTAFSYGQKFVPFMSIEEMRERTVTINSFSKNFTMTGWRVGNIVAPAYLIKVIQQINENVVFTAPSISQRAAIYALKYRNQFQKKMIEEYKERVFYAAKRINNIPKIHVMYPPEGTFYLFVNIQETGFAETEITEMLLQQAHVLTLPGTAFGECGTGYIRIACTVKKEVLKEAFDRIENLELFKERQGNK